MMLSLIISGRLIVICCAPVRVVTLGIDAVLARLGLVLIVTDFFHPFDRLAVKTFLNGYMGHSRRG